MQKVQIHLDVLVQAHLLLLPFLHDQSSPPSGDNLMKETIFEDSYSKFLTACREKGDVHIEDLIALMHMMQANEMDNHTTICGQNGCGKSYVLLMILKEFMRGNDPSANWMSNLMLADKTVDDMVQFLLQKENTMLAIDELNQYLYYKQHAEDEQNHLMKQIELARSKRIAMIGCVRDPRKLTVNYRNGKMSIVIWLVDRYKGGGSYGAVFVANPAVESIDKFGFMNISPDLIDFEELRVTFENLPSFIGYMRVPDARNYLTEEEIRIYKKAKSKSMAQAHLNYCMKRVGKKKMSLADFMDELKPLMPIIGEDDARTLATRATELANFRTPRGKAKEESDD